MTNEPILTGIIEGENILDNDFPVFCDYCYVCDGRVRQSPVQGNVMQLKIMLDVKEVRRCNMGKRNLF